jgi:hypothetical protein
VPEIATTPPLARTLDTVGRRSEWMAWHHGLPPGEAGWVRCADVDAAFMAAWERDAAAGHRREYGRTDAMTAAAYPLDWYAGLPGTVGGATFRVARRVPRLAPEVLAFRRHPVEGHPDAVALLDDEFWCLPGDPAADHPAATVVADEATLADVLRTQVRIHADRFLAWYRPGARLARRNLLGAFFDGLDCGIWSGGECTGPARAAVLADAALVLPGGTAQFREASTLYLLTDDRDRVHLTRRRVSCCHHYRVDPSGEACFTCPRTADADRPRRAAEWDDVQ